MKLRANARARRVWVCVWALSWVATSCISENAAVDPVADAAVSPMGGAMEGDAGGAGAGGALDAEVGPPIMEVSPEVVAFEPGEGAEAQPIEIHNAGGSPLHITALRLEGSTAFQIALNGLNPLRITSALEDPDGDGRPGVAPGATATLEVRFIDDALDPEDATLTITSDDPVSGVATVALRGNRDPLCLVATPTSIDFGRIVRLPSSARESITLTSCAPGPLTISRVAIEPGSDPGFSLEASPPPSGLDPGSAWSFSVSFEAETTGIFSGRLLVTVLGASGEGTIPIPLTAQVPEASCPVAVAEPMELVVAPGEVVPLTGASSRHPDPVLEITAWRWTPLSLPPGSGGVILSEVDPGGGVIESDDPGTPGVFFQADVEGEYYIGLTVEDALGCEGEDELLITARARPEGLRLELTWDTEGDLDLHLIHPLAGGWFDPRLDCYVRNSRPDWGVMNDNTDDPVLLVSSEGGGPEIIELPALERTNALGMPYVVGVHAARLGDGPVGPPRLRALWRGEVIYEQVGEVPLEGEGDYLELLEIGFDGGARPLLVPVNRYYQGAP